MSYADMFRPNNLPVEQQVARIQAPQMPQFDLSQFFSMMPRPQAQAPAPVAQQQIAQPIYEPGMAITMAPGIREKIAELKGETAPGMAMGAPAPMPAMQAPKFPSQAGMAAQALNSKAASLSGGK